MLRRRRTAACGWRSWNSRWLTTMPPAGTSLTTRSRTLLALVNRYAASGFGRELTNLIASSRDWTVTTGRIGPEDLVCHQRLVHIGIDDDGRLRCFIEAASEPPPTATSPLVAASDGGQPVEVPLVHDALAACDSSDSNFVTASLIFSTKFVADRGIGEHVVGCDADLAGVDQLDPGDPLGGDVDVGVSRDDHRALAAEFQRHRRQVRTPRFEYTLRPISVPPVKHSLSKPCCDQFLADGAVTLDHRDRVVDPDTAEPIRPSTPRRPVSPRTA